MRATTGTRRKTSVKRLPGAALAGSLLAAAVPASAASAAQDLDLRLFKTSDIAAPSACSLRLWQADRDPHEDRFAHVFLEDIDYDHMRAPARIRIGDEVVGLRRVAVGGTATLSRPALPKRGRRHPGDPQPRLLSRRGRGHRCGTRRPDGDLERTPAVSRERLGRRRMYDAMIVR